jgi:hypothetical protein
LRASVLPEYAALAFAALGRAGELAEDELAYANKVVEVASRHFIAPRTEIAPADQIAFSENFLCVLGLEVPQLTDEYRLRLFAAAAVHPDRRILAVPMLDTQARLDLAERARLLLPNEFNPGQSVIRPPDDGTIIRELTETENQEGTVSRDGGRYVIRYRTSGGQLLPRSAYIDDLLTHGEAVSGADGTAWIFLVGDVRTYANDGFPVGLGPGEADERIARHKIDVEFYANTHQDELLASRLTAGELYETRWREFPSTEALIIMILIHNAALEPNLTYDINLANETVHEMMRDGRVTENPQYLTTVRFRTQDRRIGHYARDRLSRRDYCYVRPFVNAFDVTAQDQSGRLHTDRFPRLRTGRPYSVQCAQMRAYLQRISSTSADHAALPAVPGES